MIKNNIESGSCNDLKIVGVKGTFCSIEEIDEESCHIIFNVRHEGIVSLVLKNKDQENLRKARKALKMQSCHEVLILDGNMPHAAHREILEICA